MKKVDIVIPVYYNNSHEIERCVTQLHKYLKSGFPYDWKIIVANNGKRDDSLKVAKELAKKFDRVSFHHTDKQGRGVSLNKTWLDSDADIVSYMDVDLATSLDSIHPLIRLVAEGNADITTGSRYEQRSRIKRLPLRYFLSKGYNFLTRSYLGAGFKDAQCGFKAMRQEIAKDILPLVKDDFWFWDTEMMYIAEKKGYKVKEIPIEWKEDPDSGVKIIKTVTSFLRKLRELKNRKI